MDKRVWRSLHVYISRVFCRNQQWKTRAECVRFFSQVSKPIQSSDDLIH